MELTKTGSEKQQSFLRRNGTFIAFLCAMALLGFLAQFQWVGYILIAGYAVFALVRRISARTTFILALLTLGMVPVSIILANWLVAQNFAAYSFVLLVFGVVGIIIDLRGETHTKK